VGALRADVTLFHRALDRNYPAFSSQGIAVQARARRVAVDALSKYDTAVFAHSETGRGVDARSEQSVAIEASSKSDTAVFAHSETQWRRNTFRYQLEIAF
jgi:hypothetical protein